jgi:hypothetical protein
MKKFNLTAIAGIIALFVFSIIAFQPTTTEASNNASPSATPRRRTSPSINANVKIKKPKATGYINGDDDWAKSSKQPRTKNRGKRIHKP